MSATTYTAAEPGKLSGKIVIRRNRTVVLIPAFRWIPAREISRGDAANMLWGARKKAKMMRRPAYDFETGYQS